MRKEFLIMKRCLHGALATLVAAGSLYAVPTPASAGTLAASSMELAPGILYENRREEIGGIRNAVNILNLDLINPGVRLELGVTEPIHKLSTPTRQAAAVNKEGNFVLGAINGAFNETDGTGIPATLVIAGGRLSHMGRLSTTEDGYNYYRYGIGVDASGKTRIDSYTLEATFMHGGNSISVSGMNSGRIADQAVIFTPAHRMETVGQSASKSVTEIVVTQASDATGTLPLGKEVTGVVAEVIRYGEECNAVIPQDGFVISAHGARLAAQLQNVMPGDPVSFTVRTDDSWKEASWLIQSGPLLVRDGAVSISMRETSSQAASRHPRSAIALGKDGKRAFLVTVDGRQSGYSAGMTLREFAQYLISLGADRAINLDGGGSTVMIARLPGLDSTGMVSQPSDGVERAVSTSLLALSSQLPAYTPETTVVLQDGESLTGWNTSAIRASGTMAMAAAPAPVRIGQKSIRLDYNFVPKAGETGVAALYVNADYPRLLSGKPLEIGAWVFGDGKNNWLRGTLRDGRGKQVTIDFTGEGELSWNGWKYVRASIPAGTAYPVKLERIYLAQTREERKTSGTIWLDGIEAIYDSGYQVQRFTDVPAGHWARANIEGLHDRSIISGYFDGSFQPDRKISREHAAIMLVKELGLSTAGRPDPGFTDVPAGSASYGAIATVAEMGLMVGKEPGKFMPGANLTRAEMAVILDRAYSLTPLQESPAFRDVKDSHWAAASIRNLADSKITGGYPDGTFQPSGQLTRAEFATFMFRIIQARQVS